MRTTLDIDDDLVIALRAAAREAECSLGRVVSDLLRRALTPDPALPNNGIPTFDVPPGAPVFGSDVLEDPTDLNTEPVPVRPRRRVAAMKR
jgi:hypothetical protein